MEFLKEIDSLLDAIDNELVLLNKVTVEMNTDLDTRGTENMVRIVDKVASSSPEWKPIPQIAEGD